MHEAENKDKCKCTVMHSIVDCRGTLHTTREIFTGNGHGRECVLECVMREMCYVRVRDVGGEVNTCARGISVPP